MPAAPTPPCQQSKTCLGLTVEAWAVVLFMGVGFFLARLWCPLMGDDLRITYMHWAKISVKHGLLAYPVYTVFHYVGINGRLAELFTPLLTVMTPMWLTSLLMGIVTGIFVYALVRIALPASSRGALQWQGLLAAAAVLTLPWWDSMMLVVTWLDYVGGAAATIIFLAYLVKARKAGWLALIIALLVGNMHESMGLAVICGLAVYAFVAMRSRGLSLKQLVSSAKGRLSIAYAIGAILTVVAPGIIGRMGAEMHDAMSMGTVLVTSCFYVIALILCMIPCIFMRGGVKRIKEICLSPWIIYVVAAFASTAIALRSGIIGRTGMFAQIMALIAICHFCIHAYKMPSWAMKLARLLSLAAATVAIVSCIQWAWYQRIAGQELDRVATDYIDSPDGLVYIDPLTDADIPLTARFRAITVPDADDVWHLDVFRQIYRNGEELPLIILPTEFESPDAWAQMPMTAKRAVVTDKDMKSNEHITYENIPIFLADAEMLRVQGVEPPACPAPEGYILQPFTRQGKHYWLITARYQDPG